MFETYPAVPQTEGSEKKGLARRARTEGPEKKGLARRARTEGAEKKGSEESVENVQDRCLGLDKAASANLNMFELILWFLSVIILWYGYRYDIYAGSHKAGAEGI